MEIDANRFSKLEMSASKIAGFFPSRLPEVSQSRAFVDSDFSSKALAVLDSAMPS